MCYNNSTLISTNTSDKYIPTQIFFKKALNFNKQKKPIWSQNVIIILSDIIKDLTYLSMDLSFDIGRQGNQQNTNTDHSDITHR